MLPVVPRWNGLPLPLKYVTPVDRYVVSGRYVDVTITRSVVTHSGAWQPLGSTKVVPPGAGTAGELDFDEPNRLNHPPTFVFDMPPVAPRPPPTPSKTRKPITCLPFVESVPEKVTPVAASSAPPVMLPSANGPSRP